MEAFNPAPGYEPEYVDLTFADQGVIQIRRENLTRISPKESQLLRDADFELYGDGHFDDAA